MSQLVNIHKSIVYNHRLYINDGHKHIDMLYLLSGFNMEVY